MPAPRRPDPEPLETDDVRIVALGTALWTLALAAALVFHDRLAEHGNGDWVWTSLAGSFLGLLGLRYVRRRRLATARDTRDANGRAHGEMPGLVVGRSRSATISVAVPRAWDVGRRSL